MANTNKRLVFDVETAVS